MKVLRTPDERFQGLRDFPYAPHYAESAGLRIHYLDEGPRNGEPVLLMHGEPTWCYLYRHMIPLLVDAGYRVLAPDLVGFGRSDKPAAVNDYTYQRHVDWMRAWLEHVDPPAVTLVCQDWGALIGLRLAAESPDRFARIVVANGMLPTGERRMPLAFKLWQRFARLSPWFPVGAIVAAGTRRRLEPETLAAYKAPFPSRAFLAGPRALPRLVPTTLKDPASGPNRRAWEALRRWDKPLLTAFSDGDPITRGGERVFQRRVPGAVGQSHTTIRGAGHFLQEDRGEELARVTVAFMRGAAAS